MLSDRLGHPEWKTDPRFVTNNVRVKHRVELDSMIEEITKQKTTQEWLEIFEGSGMPYAAVNDIQGTLNHSHGEFPLNAGWASKRLTMQQSRHEGWSRRSSILIAAQSSSLTPPSSIPMPNLVSGRPLQRSASTPMRSFESSLNSTMNALLS